ncbi:glycosyltransferase family 4 protein [Paenibacillus sp. GCM10027628]|uniref:glycosyltransferase family 4 protein n=1 Tax=Paenibacillus sp. GCM10027628 TaxID=3273413 RepID=UPI003640DA68
MQLIKKVKLIINAVRRVRNKKNIIKSICIVFKYEGLKGVWDKVNSITPKLTANQCDYETPKKVDYTTFNELLKINSQKRKFLILIHEMSLTGAPIAALFAAKILKDNGDFPVVVCEKDGPLKNEFAKHEITVLIDAELNQENHFKKLINKFNLVIVNTIVPAIFITYLEKEKLPVIWWIHESNLSYNTCPTPLPKILPEHIKIYCVGEYARAALLAHRKKYNAEILLYGIEDIAQELNVIFEDEKIVFSIVGTVEFRKGHKVFIKAIQLMPEHLRNRCKFIIVGKKVDNICYDRVLKLKEQFPDQVELISELPRNEIINIYKKSTAVVSSSFDDPMPIVMTEGMALSKICICSTGTGTASLLQDKRNGFVFKNGDAKDLLRKMVYIIENPEKLDKIRCESREIYEKYFQMSVFRGNLLKIIVNIMESS